MKYRNSKSTLFLMELIIAICFFAVTSAVCAQIFAKAHILSTKTTRLNHAIAQSESAAEAFKGCDGAMEKILALFPDALADNNTITIYYDSQWQPCEKPANTSASAINEPSGPAAYTLTLTRLEDDGHCISAVIEVTLINNGETIYSLDVIKYVKGR